MYGRGKECEMVDLNEYSHHLKNIIIIIRLKQSKDIPFLSLSFPGTFSSSSNLRGWFWVCDERRKPDDDNDSRCRQSNENPMALCTLAAVIRTTVHKDYEY